MLINICERTVFPFFIKVIIWSEDANPIELGCVVTKEEIEKTTTEPQIIPLIPGQQSAAFAPSAIPQRSKLTRPITQGGKEILDAMLKHPNSGERGLKEILAGDPGNNLNAAFLATTASYGSAGVYTMRKRLFREAVDELLQLGWLLSPESNGVVTVYELNPEAEN